jgi:hypothetical protein
MLVISSPASHEDIILGDQAKLIDAADNVLLEAALSGLETV